MVLGFRQPRFQSGLCYLLALGFLYLVISPENGDNITGHRVTRIQRDNVKCLVHGKTFNKQ